MRWYVNVRMSPYEFLPVVVGHIVIMVLEEKRCIPDLGCGLIYPQYLV